MSNADPDEAGCPFCRSEFVSIFVGDHLEPVDFVQCDECLAEGPRGLTEEQAQQLWALREGGADGGNDCPFCGSEDCRSDVGFVVECQPCGARGPQGPTEAIAFERWRRRGLIQ